MGMAVETPTRARLKHGILVSAILLFPGCATVAHYPGARQTSAIWQDLDACGKEVSTNSLATRCGEKFRDKPLAVRLIKVAPSANAILLMTDFGDGSRLFSCLLDRATTEDKVSRLGAGQIISIQGTFKERNVDTTGGTPTTFLMLAPCALTSQPVTDF